MILTYQEQKKGMKYSWAFSETRSKESGQLRFSVTIHTLKDWNLLSIIMQYEITIKFDVFSHSNFFILS